MDSTDRAVAVVTGAALGSSLLSWLALATAWLCQPD